MSGTPLNPYGINPALFPKQQIVPASIDFPIFIPRFGQNTITVSGNIEGSIAYYAFVPGQITLIIQSSFEGSDEGNLIGTFTLLR